MSKRIELGYKLSKKLNENLSTFNTENEQNSEPLIQVLTQQKI